MSRIPDVVRARMSFVCCEAGRTFLHAGITEIDHPGFSLRAAPTSAVSLPEEIVETYRRFVQALDDLCLGMRDPDDTTRNNATRALSSTHEPTRQVPWPPSPS